MPWDRLAASLGAVLAGGAAVNGWLGGPPALTAVLVVFGVLLMVVGVMGTSAAIREWWRQRGLAADVNRLAASLAGHLTQDDAVAVREYRRHWASPVQEMIGRLETAKVTDEALRKAVSAPVTRGSIETIHQRLTAIGSSLVTAKGR